METRTPGAAGGPGKLIVTITTERPGPTQPRVALLLLAQRSAPLRFDGVDTGLAARREAVRDVLALARPAGDGCGRAVLEIVRVGNYCQRPRPVLSHPLKLFRHAAKVRQRSHR